MRRLRTVGAVAVLALLAAGCGSEAGRYQKFGTPLCRLDTATGEVVCRDYGEGEKPYVIIPAGPYSESWSTPDSN